MGTTIVRRLIIACALLLSAGSSAVAQQISASPDFGIPGTSFTITGSGFSNTDTSVTVTYANQGNLVDPGWGVSAEGSCPVAGGSFSCSFIVPAAFGFWTCAHVDDGCNGTNKGFLQAVGNTGTNIQALGIYTDMANGDFIVVDGVSLRPSSGPGGTVVSVWGTGFPNIDTFNQVTFDGKTVAQGDTLGDHACLPSSGAMDGRCTFTVPDVQADADYPVVVGAGSTFYSATFHVTDPSQKILQDAASCADIQGAWDAGTSTCTLQSTATIASGITLTIPAGVTLVVSGDLVGLVNRGTMLNNGSLLITNGGAISNIGNIDNGGTFENRSIFDNTGTFLTVGVDAAHTGSFANRGSVSNSGLFASDSNADNFGSVAVEVNSRTCVGAGQSPIDAAVGQTAYTVFGIWDAGVCTVGLYSGSPGSLTVPQNVLWHIPAGVTLNNEGELDVSGEIDNGGSLVNQGFFVNGAYQPNSGYLSILNRLDNTGLLTNQDSATLTIAQGATLTNSGTTLDQVDSGIFIGGTLDNSGAIRIDSSSALFDYALVTNSGTIYNAGTITSRLTVNSIIDNVGGGSIINQNGGTTDGTGGTVTGTIGPTTIDLAAATCPALGGTWVPASSTCVIPAGTAFTSDVATIVTIGAGVTLESFGSFTVGGEIDVYGTVINEAAFGIGVNGRITTGALIVEPGGTFANYALLQVASSLANNGSLVNGPAGEIDMRAALANASMLSNFGVVENDGAIANTGTITDLCGGSIDTFSGGSFSGAAVVAGTCNGSPLEPTVVSLSSAPNPSSIGQDVTLSAIVSPDRATGTVTFYDGATALGSAAILVGSGHATLTTSAIGAGTRTITAQYNGDALRATGTSAPLVQTVSTSANQPKALAAADFDRDGRLDLAVAEFGADTVAILHGNGDGTFQPSAYYAVGSSPIFIAAGDFNGDGNVDLAVANYNGPSISVLIGNGDGTFRAATTYPTLLAYNPRSIAIGDVNGDGKPDLVVGSLDSIDVFPGNGDGTFQAPLQVAGLISTQATSVALADLDGDGRLDLVAADFNGNSLNVFHGRGDGTFDAPVVYQDNGLSLPFSVAVADVNGDGHPDAIVASYGTNNHTGTNLSVLLGNGDGTFQSPRNFAPGDGFDSLVVADLNGDGHADVAVANGAGSSASVVFGNGDGTFQAAIDKAVGTHPSSIVAGDFNGDGALDLVTANPDSNDLTVLLGPLGPVPDLTIAVSHAGTFEQGGTATYTIAAGNAGAGPTTAAVTVTDAMPVGLTATAITGTGWNCTQASGTVACGRSDVLAAGSTYPSITMTVQVADTAPSSVSNVATVSGGGEVNIANDSASDSTFVVQRPQIAWPAPTAISYGTALGAAQLDATAGSIAGAFSYSPAAGTVLSAGMQTLTATFTPADTVHYASATATVMLDVLKAMPVITWTPVAITYGTVIGSGQLDAIASVPGTFVYSPAAGALLGAGLQTLSTTFTPTDAANYSAATQSVTIEVAKATPAITWNNPADITYPAALGGTQLNALANVPGSFAYSPASGTVLRAGPNQALTTTFTPGDTADYNMATSTVRINIAPATPVIAWPAPAPIDWATALGSAQLDASASVSGTFAYSPPAGTVLAPGTTTLSVIFTPSDTTDYTIAQANVAILVNVTAPFISQQVSGLTTAIGAGAVMSLTSKLAAAEASIARGNGIAAAGQLRAFVNEVEALQHSGRLDLATATLLTTEAEQLIGGL